MSPKLFYEEYRSKINRRLAAKGVTGTLFPGFRPVVDFVNISRVKPYSGFFKGTKTYSWQLQATGGGTRDTESFIADDDGRIRQVKLRFPAGSEYQFYVQMQIDNAIVWPADLSQNMRGDDEPRDYDVSIPFQRGARITMSMVNDAGLLANTRKTVWADLTVKYEPRR